MIATSLFTRSDFSFVICSFDNQTLKIEIQDMEMTAKELRWKILTVSIENRNMFINH